jgi:hypothetical protein
MTPVHPTFKAIVRLAAAAVFAAGLAFLFLRAFVPDGRLTVTSDFVHPAPYVSEPKPSERLTRGEPAIDGTARTLMTGEPVFVDLTPPSRFDAVTVSLAYENSGHPAVELGALSSALDEQYVVRPIENRNVDALPWKRVTSGTLALYQRHARYASVDDFFRDPPARSKVATYGTDAPIPYRLAGYAPSPAGREIDVSLRGHHRMLTYVKDEPFNFTFVVQDMNRQAGADPVIVSVYKDGGAAPVARTVLADDGDTADDQLSSKLRAVPVSVVSPGEGVYKIEFTASADVFIRKIATRQSKLVFQDSLYLGDHVGYSDRTPPITVYSDGKRVSARTAHAESVQALTVDGGRVAIEQPNARYVREVRDAGLAPIVSPKRDVRLETDGLFALSKEEYFNPITLGMDWYVTPQDLDERGIDYVLAAYEPPKAAAGLEIATVTFDIASLAKTKDGAYRFAISAPGIGETRHALKLATVTFSMHRQPITLRNALSLLVSAFSMDENAEPSVLPDGKTYGESPN